MQKAVLLLLIASAFQLISCASKRVYMCGLKVNLEVLQNDSGYDPHRLQNNYTVTNIDSSDSRIYLISIRSNKDSSVHEISSLKKSGTCSNIRTGGSYPFVIFPIKDFQTGDKKIHSGSICLNLSGLCLY